MSLDPTTRSLVRLLLYYVLLVAGTLILERYSPAVRDAVSTEVPTGISAKQLRKSLEAGAAGAADDDQGGDAQPRGRESPVVVTGLAMAGALALVIPVAGVYMLTKRHQGYDPSVVQTVILLPIAVAGIVAVVRNSLALAFSLAGLAAAVRFRNTLKDTKDAVYIFLAIAVGLAAGVQALELGFVVSVIFNGAVVALWMANVGDIYAGEPRPRFTREFRIADPERQDGILLVQIDGTAHAAVDAVLKEHVKTWKLVREAPGEGGRVVLTYLVRLKKKTTAEDLTRAVSQGAAPAKAVAEFQSLPG